MSSLYYEINQGDAESSISINTSYLTEYFFTGTPGTTGYSPVISLYPSNTGTVFTLKPSAAFELGDYILDTTGYITGVSLSYFGTAGELLTYTTLTSFPNTYTGRPIFHSIVNKTYPNSTTYDFSVAGIVLIDTLSAIFSNTEKATLTFVDPPEVKTTYTSPNIAKEDNIYIFDFEATLTVGVSCQLPAAIYIKIDETVSDYYWWFTETTSATSFDFTVNALPGNTNTSVVCAFPLLASTTDINYITGSQRLIDTGILPSVLQDTYTTFAFDQTVPLENLALDYREIDLGSTYFSRDLSTYSNVSEITANTFLNQFNQPESSVVSVTGYIRDTDNLSLQQLIQSLNSDVLVMTISANGILKTQEYDLNAPSPIILDFTCDANLQNIYLTARPKGTINYTEKAVPVINRNNQYISPAIYFDSFINTYHASVINPYPFKIVAWSNPVHLIDQVQLYVQGSKSYPYTADLTRYDRLLPTWYFEDENQNKIETLKLSHTDIYNSNNTYIGTSSVGIFYFNDDMPTGPEGETILATPILTGINVKNSQTSGSGPGFANSKTRAAVKYYVNHVTPTVLNITRDGTRKLKPYYWYSNPIPNTITIGSIQEVGSIPTIDFTYPYTNNDDVFNVGIKGDDTYVITSPDLVSDKFSIFYYNTAFKSTDADGRSIKGFVRTSITPTITSPACQIVASTTVTTSGQYEHTPLAWVADNKNSCICKLYLDNTYPMNGCYQNILPQQYISTKVTPVTGDDEFNIQVSNITNIEVDGKYNAWITDSSANKIYKISPLGEVLTAAVLPNSASPGPIAIDNRQNVWTIASNTSELYKYSTTGNYLTSILLSQDVTPTSIEGDLNNHVWVGVSGYDYSYLYEYSEVGELQQIIPVTGMQVIKDMFFDYRGTNTNLYIAGTKVNSTIGEIVSYTVQDNNLTISLSGFSSPKYTNLKNDHEIASSIGNNNIVIHNPDIQSPRDIISKLIDLTPIFAKKTNSVYHIQTEKHISNFQAPVVISSLTANTFFKVKNTPSLEFTLVGTNKGLHLSTNKGNTWVTVVDSGESFEWQDIDISDDGKTQIAITQSQLYISTNYGSTWTASGPEKSYRSVKCSKDGLKIYACIYIETLTSAYIELQASTDYGNTWTTSSILPYSSPTVNDIVHLSVNYSGDILAVASPTIASSVLISTNYGVTWKSIGDSTYYSQVLLNQQGSYLAALPSISTGISGIYYTKSFNNEWIFTPTSIPIKLISIDQTGQYITGIDNNLNILQSDSGGASFTSKTNTYNYIEFSPDTYGLEFFNITETDLYYISKSKQYIDFSSTNNSIQLQDNDQITGIGGHSNGNVWVINSAQSKIYILKIAKDITYLLQTINIYPEIQNQTIFDNLASPYNISPLHANGDWTGIHRALKYGTRYSRTISISGESDIFEIKTAPPEVRVINDSYNLSKTISNIFPSILGPDRHPNFHNQFLQGALGTDQDSYQTIGRQFYEKISNFVMNHNDIDYCNIPQLYNLSKTMGEELDDYNFDYPPDITRVLDIASISLKRLIGIPNNWDKNLSLEAPLRNAETIDGRISSINYDITPLGPDDIVQSGDKVVIHDLFKNTQDLLYIHTTTILKNLSGYGLREPVYSEIFETFNQYLFYPYKQADVIPQTNSYIDWSNELTTLTPSQSSIDEWFKDDGIIEQLFNYYLNKGLGFITDTESK